MCNFFYFQLTGTIMVAAILEIFIGFSGLVGVLLRFIGPLTVAPTIMLMGLSVAETGFNLAGQHWGISGGYEPFLIQLYLMVCNTKLSLANSEQPYVFYSDIDLHNLKPLL
jgi:xanthine/uracil permease